VAALRIVSFGTRPHGEADREVFGEVENVGPPVQFKKVIVSCLDRGQRYSQSLYIQPTELASDSVGRFHGYVAARDGRDWIAHVEGSAVMVPEQTLEPERETVKVPTRAPTRRAAELPTTLPARPQVAEFLIVWARQRLTPCCKEVWGSVKNVGDASGYCEVRLVGIQNKREVLTKTVHSEPYMVYPGDAANFKATFYDFHWAEAWRVEVDNLKADEFGNRWLRTAFLQVTPLPLGELQ